MIRTSCPAAHADDGADPNEFESLPEYKLFTGKYLKVNKMGNYSESLLFKAENW